MIEKNLQKLFSLKTGINMKNPQGFYIKRKSARLVRRAGMTEINANLVQPSLNLKVKMCASVLNFQNL